MHPLSHQCCTQYWLLNAEVSMGCCASNTIFFFFFFVTAAEEKRVWDCISSHSCHFKVIDPGKQLSQGPFPFI